ncbi:MAG: hypothetical protein Q4F05_05595 [bacterium]|nr:hypothetical protein [bacterium]
MIVNKSLDLSHPVILNKIEEKAVSALNNQLGSMNSENKESFLIQQKEALWLLQNQKEYLLPEGRYTLTNQWECIEGPFHKEVILAQLIVAVSCKEYKTDSITEGLLMHLLQISYLNAVREYIKVVMFPGLYAYYFKEKAPFITTYYGPGLFEQPLKTMRSMYDAVGAEQIGVTINENSLKPCSSFIGSLYVLKEPVAEEMPCKRCKAKIGCEYCMIRKAR